VNLQRRDADWSMAGAVWSIWIKECVRLLVIGWNPRADTRVLMKVAYIKLDPLVYLPGASSTGIFPVCYDLQMNSAPQVSAFPTKIFR
jgi:hypothetical protein